MKRHEVIQKLSICILLTALLCGLILSDRPGIDTGVQAGKAVAATSTSGQLSKDTTPVSTEKTAATGSATSKEIRAVWVSYIDFRDAGLYNKSASTFTKNAKSFFKKLKADKINTVYFHVVPCNDAIYPSKYLGWNSYMFKNAPTYDPLKIIISASHQYNISFHAWLNPYRKTFTSIYNPASTSSTNRIVKIVKEIMTNYEVDGIHFDDYFYPSKNKGQKYYNVSISKRKKVINTMVRKIYKTIKTKDKNCEFGISPAGNIEYAESLGCDLDTWMSKSGYIDYIIPQIYWSDRYIIGGKVTKMFSDRLAKWVSMNSNDTPMYIGLGLYRAGWYNSADNGWCKKNNLIATQIKKERNAGCEGFVLFSSMNMYNAQGKKEMKNYRTYIKKTT